MDLGFDIYAMVEPKTREDYMLVLDEALSEVRRLSDLIDAVSKDLEDKHNPSA